MNLNGGNTKDPEENEENVFFEQQWVGRPSSLAKIECSAVAFFMVIWVKCFSRSLMLLLLRVNSVCVRGISIKPGLWGVFKLESKRVRVCGTE